MVLLVVVYHPTSNGVNERIMQSNVDLKNTQNSLYLITSNFDPTSTGLSPVGMKCMTGLSQIVQVLTTVQ